MKLITAGSINGRSVTAPPSKSMMQRAIAAALLADGTSIIHHPSYCDDGLSALRVAQDLGAEILTGEGQLQITGGWAPTGKPLLCGESGLCMRLFSAIAARSPQEIILQGAGSLTKRPMEMIEEPLRALGVDVRTNDGRAPISIRGPIRGGRVHVDGATSSQFLSGLLFALPLCTENSEIDVSTLVSKPYVRMTLRLLADFGIQIEAAPDLSLLRIEGGQRYNAREYRIEGDWSSASALLVAGAISGSIEVLGLDSNSLQADRAILQALAAAGAEVVPTLGSVMVKSRELRAFEFDATECPDLFPPLVALASVCSGTSVIHGVTRLIHKESDRRAALVSEFSKLGIAISVVGEVLKITGGRIRGGEVQAHHDHRIAMTLAVAGLRADSPIRLDGAESVAKSYPDFFEVFEGLKERQ